MSETTTDAVTEKMTADLLALLAPFGACVASVRDGKVTLVEADHITDALLAAAGLILAVEAMEDLCEDWW